MNGRVPVRYALAAVTADTRTGVTKCPADHPLRSNMSATAVHHDEKRDDPSHRAAGIPHRQPRPRPSHPHHRGAAPTATPTSTHPLCVPDTHPPAAGQTPTQTFGVQHTNARWHPLPAAGVLKARCKRHTGEDAMTQDHPKVFGGKFGKGLSLLKSSRTQKKYKQQSRGAVSKTPKRLRMTVRHVRSRTHFL
jgi:hypothetical protein